MNPLGALVGALAGAGVLMVALRMPVARHPQLSDRIAPYLRTIGPVSTFTQRLPRPAGVSERTGRVVLARLGARLDRLVGGGPSVRRRLAALGSPLTVEMFRQEQVLAAGAGAGIGLALLAMRIGTGSGPPALSLVGLTVLGAFVGYWLRDYWLTRAVHRREELIAVELPTIAELLALAVSAGESPLAALERVTRRTTGELSRELRTALAETRAGTPFIDALAGIAERTSLPSLDRFADGLAVAMARGTPLGEVLRAQAVDVREAGRRALLESGGKREIAMMVPVVFLVLPVTILFALYPGAVTLTSIAH